MITQANVVSAALVGRYFRHTESPAALKVIEVPPIRPAGVIVATPVAELVKIYTSCPFVPAARVKISQPASAVMKCTVFATSRAVVVRPAATVLNPVKSRVSVTIL